MKLINLLVLVAVIMFNPAVASADTVMVCHPDGTCDLVIIVGGH